MVKIDKPVQLDSVSSLLTLFSSSWVKIFVGAGTDAVQTSEKSMVIARDRESESQLRLVVFRG